MKRIHLDGLQDRLQYPKNIVVTNHTNPDGDAMGSALALALSLKKLGHSVQVVVPNGYPEFLNWLAGNDEVIVADSDMERAVEAIQTAEVIFHLDYNAIKRAGVLENILTNASATKVMIDHHQQPEDWPDFTYSDTAMSSTCQMVFEWLAMNDWLELIDEDIAYCLYTGLVTDTGSFRFAVTTDRTLQVASELVKAGVRPNQVYDRVFDSNKIGRLRLLGAMLDKMEYKPEVGAVLLHLELAELKKNNYQKGDSEGFVNYGLSISGTKLSIFLREDSELIKVSLRSKGNFDVNKLARAHFNGGGHMNAAGGVLKMTMTEALEYARNIMNEQSENLKSAS